MCEGTELPSFEWKSKGKYQEICRGRGDPEPWGVPGNAQRRVFRELRDVQIGVILKHRGESRTLIDISAGSGFHVAAVAPYFEEVVHWEAHIPSLCYASALYREKGITNVRVCRGTYLAPRIAPESADLAVAFDTFERGIEHDRMLLINLRRLLTPQGIGVVDYHARGRENASVRPYTDEEFATIANEVGFTITNLIPAAFGSTKRFNRPFLWHLAKWYAIVRKIPARKIAVLTALRP